MGRLPKSEKDVHDLERDARDFKRVAMRLTEISTGHRQQQTDFCRTVDERLRGVNDRLDQLIALAIERIERNVRLGEIERRLARLEERSGI